MAANVARVLPEFASLKIDRGTWNPQPIFNYLVSGGNVAQHEAEKTFNMGIGMMVIVAAGDANKAIASLAARGLVSWSCGTITLREDGEIGDAAAKGGKGGAVSLVGAHR